jgi:hypothetical protein
MFHYRRVYKCDVAVIGGGVGGVAAALAAAEGGVNVVLSEATDWLGGQITSQGVAALDEHALIETFGGTRSYQQLRQAIRAFYQEQYGVPARMPDGAPLNPGNGWVSRLCFEPRVALHVIETMLAPHVATGRLVILRSHTPSDALVESGRVRAVGLRPAHGDDVQVRAAYFLDATELGDLLPLTGTPYLSGAEAQSDTGEPHAAPHGPQPDEVQAFTYCVAVEYRPGENHTIAKPAGYERMRDTQPYTLTLRGRAGEPRPFKMFETSPEGLPPFWTYRRLRDGMLLDPAGYTRDIALINWAGNDYHGANLIDKPAAEQARIMAAARQLTLGFIYWLQTEAPRDDGTGFGYPGLRILSTVLGGVGGLAKAPYIRESRRIVACKRIVEQEIAASGREGARAEPFYDSVGVGWYPIDLHECVGNPRTLYEATLPFQIPLGALIPQTTSNLIAAGKNIGTTHITNGAYRLHPVEWNIGEAAGTLAAFCCALGCTPRRVWETELLLRRLQRRLLRRGVPLAWAVDIPPDHPLFVPAQLLLTLGVIVPGSKRAWSLEVQPDQPITHAEAAQMLRAVLRLAFGPEAPRVPRHWNHQMEAVVSRAELLKVLRAHHFSHLRVYPAAMFQNPPAWGELCATLAPLIENAIGSLEPEGRHKEREANAGSG